MKKQILAMPIAAAALSTSAYAADCYYAIDKTTSYNWDECGSKYFTLQFDVQTSQSLMQFFAGYHLGKGACKGGITNCAGTYVPSQDDPATKSFIWQPYTTSEGWAYWVMTDKFVRHDNCPNNPQWFQETSWTQSYTTGWSYVYCN